MAGRGVGSTACCRSCGERPDYTMSLPVMERTFRDVERVASGWNGGVGPLSSAGYPGNCCKIGRGPPVSVAGRLTGQLRLAIASVSDGGGTSVLRCWPSDTLPRETYWVLIRCQRVYTGFVLCSAATRSSDTEEGVKAPPVPVTHFMEQFPVEQTCDDTLCSAQPS